MAKLQQDLELRNLEHTQQKQDYEDLLVLLEDQDSKIKKFKVGLHFCLRLHWEEIQVGTR